MKIDRFIQIVTQSRKRTGIVLLDPEHNDLIAEFEMAGVKIIDLSQNFTGQVILADNIFLQLLTQRALGAATCYTNIEVYLGPRFEENHYLRYLLPKLINSEPLNPIFLVFYSKLLFEKFKSYYLSRPANREHIFEDGF